MKILSELFKITLDKNPTNPEFFNVKVYPNVEKMPKTEDGYRLTLSLSSLKTSIDFPSLVAYLVANTYKSEDELIEEYLNGSNLYSFDYLDSVVELDLQEDDCISQIEFSYTDLMEVGFMERELIEFDINFNSSIMGGTLILAEVFSILRNVFLWPEYLEELV